MSKVQFQVLNTPSGKSIVSGPWTPSLEVFVGPASSLERRYLASNCLQESPTSLAATRTTSSLDQVLESKLDAASGLTTLKQKSGTPSRIPVPKRSKSLVSDTPTIISVNAENLSIQLEQAAANAELDEISKKKQMLAVLREKKSQLKSKLCQSVSSSTEADPPTPPEAEMDVPASQLYEKIGLQDSEPLQLTETAEVILSNLDMLSSRELDKLTQINTTSNKPYTRSVQYQDVVIQGPKPLSPNAKTLSKFALQARKQDALERLSLVEQDSRCKIRWNPQISHFDPYNVAETVRQPAKKSCLKMIPHHNDAAASVETFSKSPIVIKRMFYKPLAQLQIKAAKAPAKSAKKQKISK